MGLTSMLADVKAHLEQAADLVTTHVPALVEWAERAESDPLVAAAIDLAVPETTRAMLAQLLKSVEADVQQVEEAAKAAAAATAPPPETVSAEGEPPAEPAP